jgi:hypothetical protein
MQWIQGVLGRRVKLTTNHDLLPRLRMGGTIPPFPQYVVMACCLVKHGGNFTYTYTRLSITSKVVCIDPQTLLKPK